MIRGTATIKEKTDLSLVLIPDLPRSGYAISCINEHGIIVSPRECNNVTSEGFTVMFFEDDWLNTVFEKYNVGDKIGIEYKQIKD